LKKPKLQYGGTTFSIPPQMLNFFHRRENALFSNVCISTDHTTLCPNLGVMPSYSDAKNVFFFQKLKLPSKFQKKSKLKIKQIRANVEEKMQFRNLSSFGRKIKLLRKIVTT
jgi:hypothetical protein